MDLSVERANTLSRMVQYMRVNGPITKFKATENRRMLTERFTMANGLITTWKVMESTSMLIK